MRTNVLKFIYYKILNINPEEQIPKKFVWLYRLFFPINYYLMNNKIVQYDCVREIFTIYGIQYSEEIFKIWALSGTPTGIFSFKNENNKVSFKREIPKNLIELDLIDWIIKNKSEISKSTFEVLHSYYKGKEIL